MYEFLTEAVKKECLTNEKLEIPLVMIGHSKDFFNDKNFEKFIKTVVGDDCCNKVNFSALQKFTDELTEGKYE